MFIVLFISCCCASHAQVNHQVSNWFNILFQWKTCKHSKNIFICKHSMIYNISSRFITYFFFSILSFLSILSLLLPYRFISRFADILSTLDASTPARRDATRRGSVPPSSGKSHDGNSTGLQSPSTRRKLARAVKQSRPSSPISIVLFFIIGV